VATNRKAGAERATAASRLIGKLMHIGALIERSTNRLLLPHDLNHQQFAILFEIFRAGKVQQKDLINRLLLERAHVSKVVKKLQAMGLVEAVPHPDDGRSCWLSVSPDGTSVVRSCQALFDVQKREWFRRFETAELLRLLDRVTALQSAFMGIDAASPADEETTEDPS
jgi:DNA-binding MarR family transcriptional regulator